MEQCFKVINELRTTIDIEYNGVQPGIFFLNVWDVKVYMAKIIIFIVATPVPVNNKPVEPQQVRNRLQFSNENIYATQTNHIAMMEDRTNTIFYEVAEKLESTPSTVPRIKLVTNDVWVNVKKSQMIEMLKRLELQVGHSGHFRYLYTDSVTRHIQIVFNKYQLIVWAVQSLGTLTAASLKEDPYGYVQNDLTKVMNQLLGCLVDVEKYLQAPPAQYNSWLKDENVVIEESEAVILGNYISRKRRRYPN